MKNQKKFASGSALLIAVVTMAGTSAFAESRPSNETRGQVDRSNVIQRNGTESSSQATRGNDSPGRSSERQPTIERRADRAAAGDRADAWQGARNRGESSPDTRTQDGDRSRIGREDRNQAEGDRRNGDNRGQGQDRSNGNWRNGDNRGHRHDRSNGDWRNGDRDRGGDNRGNGEWRNGNHYPSRGGSYGHGQPYYGDGRVSQIRRYGSGFRIWILGSPYPFFVPEAYYYRNHFRVGLSIRLGGYYNPLGYYDYYDPYDYDSYDGYDSRYDSRYDQTYSRGSLRGTVESVDSRRDSFVVRNEATGSFVTVSMRDRRDSVRPGDYVELSGSWSRNGLFEAYDVRVVDYDNDRR